jgi:hypothetical protein
VLDSREERDSALRRDLPTGRCAVHCDAHGSSGRVGSCRRPADGPSERRAKRLSRLPDLSLHLTTMEAPQGEAEHSQTNCRRWHQSADSVAVRRRPRHHTSRDGSSENARDGRYETRLRLQAIALTCAIRGFFLQLRFVLPRTITRQSSLCRSRPAQLLVSRPPAAELTLGAIPLTPMQWQSGQANHAVGGSA